MEKGGGGRLLHIAECKETCVFNNALLFLKLKRDRAMTKMTPELNETQLAESQINPACLLRLAGDQLKCTMSGASGFATCYLISATFTAGEV